MDPETRYAKSGDLNVAYQVVGDDPFDLLYVAGWVSHVEEAWEEPSIARFLRRLAVEGTCSRASRGSGLSTRRSNEGPHVALISQICYTVPMGYGPAYGLQPSVDTPVNWRIRLALSLGRLAFVPCALFVLALVLSPVAQLVPLLGAITAGVALGSFVAIHMHVPLLVGLVGLAFAAFEPVDDPENASARLVAMAVNVLAIAVQLLALYWFSENPLWT